MREILHSRGKSTFSRHAQQCAYMNSKLAIRHGKHYFQLLNYSLLTFFAYHNYSLWTCNLKQLLMPFQGFAILTAENMLISVPGKIYLELFFHKYVSDLQKTYSQVNICFAGTSRRSFRHRCHFAIFYVMYHYCRNKYLNSIFSPLIQHQLHFSTSLSRIYILWFV